MRARLSCQRFSQTPSASIPVARKSRHHGLLLSGLAALTLAGCAGSPQRYASNIDPRYGVAPSPRVVAEGAVLPRGGGSYVVGTPYVIAGKTHYPSERAYAAVGLAS